MGDRTWCTLTIPAECLEQACELLDNVGPENAEESLPGLSYFSYDGVNYGKMAESEEEDLKAAGIPFDWEWGDGSDYHAGCTHIRFTEAGELIVRNIQEGDEDPPLYGLKPLIDKPAELRQYILDWEAEHTVLPWTDQVEYGKRYRTLQLINAS